MGFTERQDLELTAGLDVDLGKAQVESQPFFQVRENNWGVHFRNNNWQVTYDL